jgi:hypothetical protein
MSKVLVISSGDWGDEFDLEGFAIFEKDTWEHIKEGIPNEPFDAYFGTNEFVCFENKKDYLSHLVEKDISEEEEKFLRSLLNIHTKTTTYGLFVINSDNY